MTSAFALPKLCLLRAVPDAFDRCLRRDPAPIDVALARLQHRPY